MSPTSKAGGEIDKIIEVLADDFKFPLQAVMENKAQNFKATFTQSGVHLITDRPEGWTVEMELVGFGWRDQVQQVPPGKFSYEGNQAEWDRGALIEWYLNEERGLEQGFTVEVAPEGFSDELVFQFKIDTPLDYYVDKDSFGISFHTDAHEVLNYSGLYAEDAFGQPLSARLEKNLEGWDIVVEARDAAFPILVDPVFYEDKKIVPFDAAEDLEFGGEVESFGDHLFVRSSEGGSYKGSVYAYRYVDGEWEFVQKMYPDEKDESPFFGTAISADETWLAIGAHNNDGPLDTPGNVYLYKFNGSAWDFAEKISSPEPVDPINWFGNSVEISESRLVIGAALDTGFTSDNEGAVYVYNLIQNRWVFEEKLVAPDGEYADQFGGCVSTFDDIVLVGCDRDDDLGSNSGSVYVFRKEDTGWTYLNKLLPSNGDQYFYFGSTIDFRNNRLAVSAFGYSHDIEDQGAVYIFNYLGDGLFQESDIILANDAYEDYTFGVDLQLIGKRWLAVSAYSWDELRPTHLFRIQRDGIWDEVDQLLPRDIMGESSFFGNQITYSRNRLFVTARGYDDPQTGDNVGAVYIYDVNDDIKVSVISSVIVDREGSHISVITSELTNGEDPTGMTFRLQRRMDGEWVTITEVVSVSGEVPELEDNIGIYNPSEIYYYQVMLIDGLGYETHFPGQARAKPEF